MFLVLDFPAFPLQVLQRLEAAPPPGPAVVTEAAGKQSRVVAANEGARAAGIELGQSAARARARRDNVQVYTRQPTAEAAAMDLLFALAYTHTPFLERTAPGLFTLELRGLKHGSPERLAHALLGELCAHGFVPRLGLGPTPDLALFTARATTAEQPLRLTSGDHSSFRTHHSSFHHLPLTAANPSDKLLGILGDWGLHTLGDLTALLKGRVIAAHNNVFDIPFLDAEYARAGSPIGLTRDMT
ncbi:MAG: hypothetical protein ACLFU2_08270, partial [Opitutales bacterium]